MLKAWRDEFFHACGRHGIPVRIARTILRHASTLQRAAEVDCSVSAESVRTYWEARADRAQAALLKLRAGSDPAFSFEFGGDPRGCVVRIVTASAPDGIGVPGEGFTAARMESLCAMAEAQS